MDIKLFTKMLSDKHFSNYSKMKHKYGSDFNEFLKDLEVVFYKTLPLDDFNGENIVYLDNVPTILKNINRFLMAPQGEAFGIKSAEEEIISSSAIESIDFNRESVRNILKGFAPKDEQENRILGQKKGLEFIADISNKITEENLYKLYMMTVGDFNIDENKLLEGNCYRHDTVFIISDRVEHSGANYKELPKLMKSLIDFINAEDNINDLIKAAIIHFYIAYLHPYFDGNGRMARLVHLWYLVQSGYQSALFIPFSSKIAKTKNEYYNAFSLIESNEKISGKIDVTPFLIYFINNVYNKLLMNKSIVETLSLYKAALDKGEISEKESKLWQFVLSAYGTDEFSTKQLEKDFNDVAYATVRSFVMKFEKLGLLLSIRYGSRTKYKVKQFIFFICVYILSFII